MVTRSRDLPWDLKFLTGTAIKEGIMGAAQGKLPRWLPFALDALLNEEALSNRNFAPAWNAACAQTEELQRVWQQARCYIQVAKDSGIVKTLPGVSDYSGAEALASGQRLEDVLGGDDEGGEEEVAA